MREAETQAMAGGGSARDLMERAGAAAAAAILRFDAPHGAVVVCGPGGNGGDGYVVARHLAAAGVAVTVAADGPPRQATAVAAAADWHGPVVPLAEVRPAEAMIDALFGIGMTRPLEAAHVATLCRLSGRAGLRVALDLPSGVGTDDGSDLGCPYFADLTIAFGALKPAHLLYPAAGRCGRVVIADIGVPVVSPTTRNPRPAVPGPAAAAHKFSRGSLLVAGGPPGHGGAARLAARAALGIGAGLVTLAVTGAALAENAARLDAVMLHVAGDGPSFAAVLDDRRIGALLLGPGLGHDERARELVVAALASDRPLVLDGDIFTLFADDPGGLSRRRGARVLTPHEGEFVRLFGELPGSKLDRARAAAALTGAIIVLKGPDTVIAHPDGRARINAHASPDLATAGSGDVLTGLIAGLIAQGLDAFDAACAGVWLHGDLGLRGGRGLTADAMPGLIPAALAGL